MAIQNFLSGGYYGKLGATVGQRWKNKRTIRTYVVPANPRTPTQQANRNKFANAVTYAQMGMQMNFYATCFENPNFTKWNYRMKTARELKNAGLTGLDLIPLYPFTFVPQTLLQEITIDGTQGQKHITFAIPNLNENTDRVFSLMFDLYSESNAHLGLKLYLGYYYASNPGFLEVDVDDVNEINDNCLVRIVSNDDVDSATDLIASPTLQVQASSIDIRAFNTTIREVQKSSTGIKVIFAELWKGTPTVNSISISSNFVSGGTNKTATATATQLINENGYCSVTIPFVTSNNQNLPAYPNGSNFIISSVDYEGATWQYTKTNDTIAYSDSDLTRTINASPTWNASDTGDITFRIAFGGTVAAQTKNFSMVCSGRMGLRTSETQEFNVVGTDEQLIFTCTGSRKRYPMNTSGDKISITAMQFTCNGVTYNLAAQDINLRNAITTSYFLETLEWTWYRDGGGQQGDLYALSVYAYIENLTRAGYTQIPQDYLFNVEIVPNLRYCIPDFTEYTGEQDGSDFLIQFMSNFDGVQYSDQVQENSGVGSVIPTVTLDGITYTFSNQWWNANKPATIAGFEV